MTSNLDELKAALYEDFDEARSKATRCWDTGGADFKKAGALYMQAAAKAAEDIITLETGRGPAVRK